MTSRICFEALPAVRMEMKKIALAALFIAASMIAALAHEGHDHDLSPAASPEQSGGASADLTLVGSLIGASLASLIAYYLHY